MFDKQGVVIKKVIWDGEDEVEFQFTDGSVWCGASRKDFWCPDDEWEAILKPGVILYLWTHSFSTVVGFQCVMDNGDVKSVWCCGNDFEYKKERDKTANAYENFIIKEGKRISKWIDQGKTYVEINKLIDKGHSGNTFGCALAMGVRGAKNKENADRIRKEHNGEYGVNEEKAKGGVVNPAILTIGGK